MQVPRAIADTEVSLPSSAQVFAKGLRHICAVALYRARGFCAATFWRNGEAPA
jgi:hypothetical protein